jgi:hypothetical protein
MTMTHLPPEIPRIMPAPLIAAAGDGESAMLDFAGRLEGAHALVLADHGRDLLCALIRRNCDAATSFSPSRRPEADLYDLVLVPELAPDSPLGDIVSKSRRALVPTGRLVIRTIQDPAAHVAAAVARLLRLNGFVRFRVRTLVGQSLLRADLPMFGCARAA